MDKPEVVVYEEEKPSQRDIGADYLKAIYSILIVFGMFQLFMVICKLVYPSSMHWVIVFVPLYIFVMLLFTTN